MSPLRGLWMWQGHFVGKMSPLRGFETKRQYFLDELQAICDMLKARRADIIIKDGNSPTPKPRRGDIIF